MSHLFLTHLIQICGIKAKENTALAVNTELRRTRYRCTELDTGRTYLISADAPVLSTQ